MPVRYSSTTVRGQNACLELNSSISVDGSRSWLLARFDGQVFATYLLCYAVTRSTVELFRGDYNAGHQHFGLTPAQLVSVPIFFTGLALAIILSRRAPAR